MILVQDMMRTDITGLMKKIPEEKGFQERGIFFVFLEQGFFYCLARFSLNSTSVKNVKVPC
jgi:hypothetical protein